MNPLRRHVPRAPLPPVLKVRWQRPVSVEDYRQHAPKDLASGGTMPRPSVVVVRRRGGTVMW